MHEHRQMKRKSCNSSQNLLCRHFWLKNKSQGQSVKNVGIHFQTPVFTHGQFYVAMSRCTSANCVKILFPEDSTSNVTKNIVFPEALLKDTL